MNRKQFITNLSGIGLLSYLPNYLQASTNVTNHTTYFLGLGRAGSIALLEFAKQNLKGTFTAINTNFNEDILTNKKIETYVWKEGNINSDNWKTIKDLINTKTINNASSKEHYVLLIGLGGNTGLAIMTGLVDMLKNEKKDYTVIATIPFCFEKTRQEFAHSCLKILQPNINLKCVFADNLRIKYPGIKMRDAMKTLDKEMLELWLDEVVKLNLIK